MKNTIKNMSTLMFAAAEYTLGHANMEGNHIMAESTYAIVLVNYDEEGEVFNVEEATRECGYEATINLSNKDSLDEMIAILSDMAYEKYEPEDATDAYEMVREYDEFKYYMLDVIEKYCD